MCAGRSFLFYKITNPGRIIVPPEHLSSLDRKTDGSEEVGMQEGNEAREIISEIIKSRDYSKYFFSFELKFEAGKEGS